MTQTDIWHVWSASGLSRDIMTKCNNFAIPRRRRNRKNSQAQEWSSFQVVQQMMPMGLLFVITLHTSDLFITNCFTIFESRLGKLALLSAFLSIWSRTVLKRKSTELTGSVRVLKPRAPSPVMLSCSCEGSAGERDGDDEINMRNQTSQPSRWGHGVIEPRDSSVLLLINKSLSINSRTLLNKCSFL